MKEYPSDLIYEPWKASAGEQRRYKCEIGKDYPARIVIHEDVKDINMGSMKRAYEVHNGLRDESDLEPPRKVVVKEEVHRPFIKVEPKQEPTSDDEDPENIC